MSELQIGLLVIGVLVVGGVLAYNRVQERGARRDAEGGFGGPRDDVLLSSRPAPAGPVEPALDAAPPAEAGPVPGKLAPRFPVEEPAAAEPATDPAVDYVVEFATADPAAEATVHEQWAAIARRHAPRARLDRQAEAWFAGLQMVTRDGPVGEAELIEFRSTVETMAAAVGAVVKAPEMRRAVEAARALDAVCADADIQVVVHVEGGPFAGTKLRATAEAAGLVLEPEGRFALRNDAGQLLYTLAARDGSAFSAATMRDAAPAGLSLALDLGRTPDTRRSFESLARLAHQLAAVLGGSIVDDNGNVLDERAVAAIAQQLEAVAAQLRAHGITPGSATALRLFA